MKKHLLRAVLLAMIAVLVATMFVAPASAAKKKKNKHKFVPPTFQPQDVYNAGTGVGACGGGGGVCPDDIANADFDNDGDIDLVSSNRFGEAANDITVFINDGTGHYPDTERFGGTVSAIAVDVGDFNGDGKPDVVVADPDTATGSVWVFLNNSTPGNPIDFLPAIETPVTTITKKGIDPTDLAVNDFNGDGNLDVAVTNNQSGNVTILLGDGAGGFTIGDTFAQTFPLGIDSGDFNGDGKPDLVVTSTDITGGGQQTVTAYLNDGTGVFTASQTITVGSDPVQVIVADFNGDGKSDFAVSNNTSNTVSLAFGLGNGQFLKDGDFPLGPGALNPYELAVGDYNGDAILDIAVRNIGSNNVTVLTSDLSVKKKKKKAKTNDNRRGNGHNRIIKHKKGKKKVRFTFVPVSFEVGNPTGFVNGITTADLDGNKKLDLAATNFADNTISVLLRK